MLTKTVDVHELQVHLQELLTLMATGTEVVLMEDNRPIARLVPVASPVTGRVAGLHPGAIWTSDDFDEPLPDEFWAGTIAEFAFTSQRSL
jgi:antitoxin (DNA-binding transcriptional repressor) of toxin-antitoxin stability system